MASAYWEQRASLRQAFYDQTSDAVTARVYSAYDSALRQFETDIQTIFGNFQRFHNLTPDEARKLLNEPANQLVLADLRLQVKKVNDPVIQRELLVRINAPAYAARITRLQAAREAAYVNMGKVADVSLKRVESHLVSVARESYWRMTYDVQKSVGIMFGPSGMSMRRAQEIQKQIWSGEHYSQRLWGNCKQMAQLLTNAVQENAISGKTTRETFQALTDASAGGKVAANRLIRTETNYVAGQGEMESYRDAGIEKYEFVAVLDGRTSTICQELDGKEFSLSDQTVGVNMHPMHPWCRSTTAPVFSWAGKQNLQRRARDPVTGETTTVPASITYSDWKRKLDETYGPERMALSRKMMENESYDRAQFARYKERLGKDTPGSFSAFQSMKYGNAEAWGALESKYSNWLYEQDFGGIIEMQGTLPDQTVRRWYKHHAESIPDRIDTSKPAEDQAKQAHALRNQFRTEARLLMADRESAAQLDITDPNLTFDELIAKKINDSKKPDITTREQAIMDILKTATKTNKGVNQKLGIE